MRLDVTFIGRRQRELGLSRRDIANALSISLARVTNLYAMKYHGTFTLVEVGRLADTLACSPERLIAHDHDEQGDSGNEGGALLPRIGALLRAADGPVSVATLADVLDTDLDDIEAALERLDEELTRLGLAVRRNTNDGSISIVSSAIVSNEQLQAVLRGEHARRDLGTSAAALLHRIMTQRVTPRSVESSNDRRVQFGRLVNAGFVIEPSKRTQPAELSDDVRESLLLDVR